MAAKITDEKKAVVLALIGEGNGVNAVAWLLKISKPSVLRIILEVGEACEAWMDENFMHLRSKSVQIDEAWSYCGIHGERMAKDENRDETLRGDWWLLSAICEESRLITSWHIGRRTQDHARPFVADLAKRFAGPIQVTSDGTHMFTRPKMEEFIPGQVNYAKLYSLGRNSIRKRSGEFPRL